MKPDCSNLDTAEQDCMQRNRPYKGWCNSCKNDDAEYILTHLHEHNWSSYHVARARKHLGLN